MNFWEKITGSDMSKEFKGFELRAKNLPADYQAAWEQMKSFVWPHADFTGRNLMPVFEGVLDLFEAAAANAQSVQAVLGDDIKGFCSELVGEAGAASFRDQWRAQLNTNVAKKLGQSKQKMTIQHIIEGKKRWRAHMARVKALPQDYQTAYKEIQEYLFKMGVFELNGGMGLLSGIIDLFEEGTALGKGVLEVTGTDVAAFCDGLIKA